MRAVMKARGGVEGANSEPVSRDLSTGNNRRNNSSSSVNNVNNVNHGSVETGMRGRGRVVAAIFQ